MTNAVKQLRSSYGFESPYFIVDAAGNLLTQTITVTGSRIELTAGSYISYSGTALLTQTSLGSTITNIPGTLTGLKVGGALSVTGSLSVTDGTVASVINPGLTGSINNMTIGASVPRAGTFSSLTVAGAGTSLQLTPATATISPVGTFTLGTTAATTNIVGNTNFTSSQNINISPTAITVNGVITVGLLTINPSATGSMDNMVIGKNTAAAGSFTTVTHTAPDEKWNGNIRSYGSTKRYAENISIALSFFSMGQ